MYCNSLRKIFAILARLARERTLYRNLVVASREKHNNERLRILIGATQDCTIIIPFSDQQDLDHAPSRLLLACEKV